MKTTYKYQWNIVTNMGLFSGTCSSIDTVNLEVALLTNNARILKKNIIPVTTSNDGLEDKIYTWKIIRNYVQASGIAKSLKEAKKAIQLFDTKLGDKINITESFKTIK